MQIRVDDRNIDFNKYDVVESFDKSLFFVGGFGDERSYVIDYDFLKMSRPDLVWLIQNNIDCVVLIQGKTWLNIKLSADLKNKVKLINKSDVLGFIDVIRMIFREKDRRKVYKRLKSEKISPIIIQRWLLSCFPTDTIIKFLDRNVMNQELYYRVVSLCFKPRTQNPSYKLYKPKDDELEYSRSMGCSLWEANVYRPLVEKLGG